MTRQETNQLQRGGRRSIIALLIALIVAIYLVSLKNMLWLTGSSQVTVAKEPFIPPLVAANTSIDATGRQQGQSEPALNKNSTREQPMNRSVNATVISTAAVAATTTQTNTSTSWPGRVDHIADSLNRIVILIATCPYLEMLDNLIRTMRDANVTNFVVVPLDDTTYKVALKLYPNHVVDTPPHAAAIQSSNAKQPATFGSKEFQALTASRPIILEAFLRLGYTVFYSDTDTVWQSNPLDLLESNVGKDLVGMQDHPTHNETCSCFLYFKPTNNSFSMLQTWSKLIQTKRFQHDQVAFHATYLKLRNETNIKLYPPDNPYFPNGKIFFEQFNKTQQKEVMIVHNNFVFGYEAKKKRFVQHDLWHPTAKLLEIEYTC